MISHQFTNPTTSAHTSSSIQHQGNPIVESGNALLSRKLNFQAGSAPSAAGEELQEEAEAQEGVLLHGRDELFVNAKGLLQELHLQVQPVRIQLQVREAGIAVRIKMRLLSNEGGPLRIPEPREGKEMTEILDFTVEAA